MKVYVLFHDTRDEGSEVRGVYATQELAEEALVWSEYRRDSHTGHEWWSWHGEYCCGVEEMEIRDHLELPFHGPENINMDGRRRGGWLVPAAFMGDIVDLFARDTMLIKLVDNSKPIGTVETITEHEDGHLTVDVKLRDQP